MQNLSSSPRQVLSTILYIVLVVACLQVFTSSAYAATGINKQINFQGKVVNTNGTNVANGDYDFVFKIYTVSSGGVAVWTETWNSGTSQVTVTDGVFRVALGTHTTLPGSIDFNTDNIYLGVEFNGDGEMDPRVRFTAVPYAFNAEKVSGLTVTNTTGTFTLANGKTLTVNNTLSFSGTDSTAFTLPGSSDTLVGLDAAQTLTNKTLTAPKFADGGFLADASGNELLILDSNASAVNEITLANAATGNGVSFTATGGDSNVAFSILSKAAGALTLDSGTTGTVNLGTGNNAKTLNLGTGNAGNTINIGTNNSVSDTINIGSALDNVAITGDDWSITSAGALTVASCTGCGGGGANTALSNLASVAINTSLVSDTDVTDDLGTSSIQWRQLFVGGDQTTSAYGIQFGATNPVNLFRSAANTLSLDTNDSLVVGSGLTVNGNTVLGDSNTADTLTAALLTSAFTSGATTQTAFTTTATSLTTGTALDINATNTATTNTPIQQARFDLTNAQATNANSSFIGLAVNFNQNPTVAANTEYAMRIQNQVTAESTDQNVAGLLWLDNADTSASGSTAVADALLISYSGNNLNPAITNAIRIDAGTGVISNGINFSDSGLTTGLNFSATPATNYVSGANWTVTSAGAGTFASTLVAATDETINGLDISSGSISDVAGYTQSTGAFAFSGGGNFSIDSAGLDVTTGGALTGVASIDTITMSATAMTFAGVGTISSTTGSAITLDSGTTGTVNLGTGNNAKTINLGTGTAGNAINIGSDNTTKDTLTIGSALDDVAITGDQWSITNAGVLTVVSCTGCGGSSGANTALSNLASVAVNASLIAGTTDTLDLGSSAIQWRKLYIGGDQTTTSYGLQFGVDGANAVNLYRSANNTLRTNGVFNVNGNFNVTTAGVLSGITGYTQSSGTMSLTTNATTGSGSSSGLYINADTVTSGNGLYINAAGLIANGSAQYINGSSAVTSGTTIGSTNVLSVTNSSSSSGSFLGLRGQAYVNNSAALTGVAAGLEGVAQNANSQTVSHARGVQGFVNQSHASGTITNGRAFFAQVQNTTGTITTGTGLYVADASAAGTLTTQYGVYIDAMTKGGTNVALCFDCDGTWTASTVASGIQFGTDANTVNLYRSASDTLRTDDAFSFNGTASMSSAGALTGLTGFTQTSGTFAFTNSSSTGNAFAITGPTGSVATNNHFVNLAADTGNSFGVLGITTDYSGSSTAGYGIYNAGTDSTVNTNTDYGYYGTITASGVATGKTVYGVYQNITTSGTNPDTLYSGYFTQSNTAGGISSGTRNQYGVYSTPGNTAQNTGGTTNIYGFYGSASYAAGANSTGSTQNIYGAYLTTTGTLVTGGTINQYGLYIADGSSSTTGTSAKYGLYIAPQTAATNNYGICFDCDGSWNSSTVASGLQFGTDANAVTLYRSASDTLRTGDSLTVDLDMTLSGGDIAGANSAAIDIGEATSGSITLSGPATGTSAGFVRVPVKTDAGDPTTTQTNGAIYYNSSSNKFRCYEASAWANCIGSGGSSTWNGITDPTGTQTLAFGDAELNAWTISSDTESFWTMTADSLTTGKLYDISLDGLTTGVGINMQSTSTALTTGSLMNLEWAPTGSITSTSDLFVMNIGSGDLANTFINLKDNGSSVLSVSQSQFTTSLPTNFTAPGDVSIAYDIAFTNPTASYITSLAPITIRSGESFNSSDLTLQTYNYGNIIFATSDNGIMRVPVKTTTGDPTNDAEGNMYYNEFDNKFRCFQGSAWTDCIGAGGSTTLQQAYDAGTPTILTDASGDIIFRVIGGATDTQFEINAASAPEIDIAFISNAGQGTVTDGVDGLTIDFVQADDAAGTDTNAGLNVGITAASDDLGDVLSAISVSVTSPTANNRERGITIGTGFDEDIHFASASAMIRMQDGGEIKFTDGSVGGNGTSDIPLARIKEYFTGANYGVVESTGFINIDGSFYMDNFVASRPPVTADSTASNYSSRIGDTLAWGMDERGTGGTATNATFGCTATQGDTNTSNNVNGVLQISLETSTNTNGTNLSAPWCQVAMQGTPGNNVVPILQAANKFIMYYKVKMSSAYTNSVTGNSMWFGANNQTNGGWIGKPTFTGTSTGGVFITNVDGTQTQTGTNATVGTQWVGWTRYNGNNSTVACSGVNPTSNTSNYALFRIEVRATNDARFFIDGDTSNGVQMTECGSGITANIPTAPMRPAMVLGRPYMNSTGTVWTAFVDLFAYVQDDPRDMVVPGMEAQAPPEQSVFNPIQGADLAEHYIFTEEDNVEMGDVVSMGDSPGDADKASRAYDRRLLGVIAESPGLILGDTAVNSLPVAISGRVPVKVSAKNGEIKIGDPITSSDIPGVAMKATTAGKIIGTAMEKFDGDGTGKILVSINPGYYINDGQDLALVENQSEMVLGATSSAELAPTDGIAIQASGSATPLPQDEPSLVGQVISNMVLFENGLRVDKVFESVGDAVFYGKARFEGAVEYLAAVVFKDEVEFEKTVTFNSDTAGYAVIQKGQRFVDVTFDNEYKNQPVIQISPSIFKLTEATFKEMIAQEFCTELEGIEVCQDRLVSTILDSDLNYAVQNQTTQGFLIVLDREAPVNMTFSWQATAVKNVKTAVNNGPAGLGLPFKGDYQISNKFGEHSENQKIKDKDVKLGLSGHDGYDIGMPMETPILAVDDGVVESRNSDYGMTLVLKHEWGETLYGHLSDITVEVGQKVTKGQEVALSGNSGLTTGPHLHFGMKLNDSKDDNGYRGFVNPNLYLAFEKHRAASAVAGVSTRLDSVDPRRTHFETNISASSSSILHTEEEQVVSSSSASVTQGNTTRSLEKGGREL